MEDSSLRFVVISFAICFVYFLACIPALSEYGMIFGDGMFRSFLDGYFQLLIPFVRLVAILTPLRGWAVFIIASLTDCLLYAMLVNAFISILRNRRKR